MELLYISFIADRNAWGRACGSKRGGDTLFTVDTHTRV